MKIFKVKPIVIFSLILVVSLIYFFFKSQEQVYCVKVIKGDIQDSVTGNVKILAEQTYQIKSSQYGTVKSVAKLPIEQSIFLKKNDIIVQLDITDINRSLNEAISSKQYLLKKSQIESPLSIQLKIELNELDALKKLSEEEKISLSSFNRKENLVKQLESRIELEKISDENELFLISTKVDSLKSQIKQMSVRSPIDGELIYSNLSPGDLVSKGQTIGTLISKERLIEASLNEEDFLDLKKDLPAAVTLFSSGKSIIESKVDRLSRIVDSSTGRRLLYLKANQSTPDLPTGSTGRLSIIRNDKKDSVLIPKKSLIGSSVLLVKNNKIQIRDLQIGIKNLLKVEVLEGLNPGDIIVGETPHIFKEGQHIKPILFDWNK